MRISDWSSDVCSSDLVVGANARQDWPSGWVQHRSIRLDQLVAQANRYSGKPIILDDNATAALIASGRFQINKTDVFVERIAESLKLRISYRDDGMHLRKRYFFRRQIGQASSRDRVCQKG